MKVIGLLGGVASGKSTVASFLKTQGWKIITADELAHQVLHDPLIIRQLQVRWGIPILVSGYIDRKSIAKIVFSDLKELEFLENLVFPILKNMILTQIQESQNQNTLLDAPTLLRAKLESLCHEIWFVNSDRDIRLQRYIARTKSDGLDMDKRDSLLFLDIGESIAQRIIENNLSEKDLLNKLLDIMD